MSGIGYPKFRNDRGVPEICIGVKEFKCIGMATRRTASLLIVTQPEQSRSLGDKRQVVCVDPVKWAAIAEARTRVGSARDDRKKRGLASFRADIAC